MMRGLVIALLCQSALAVDVFLQIFKEGAKREPPVSVDGDSQDSMFTKSIDVFAWSWGASKIISPGQIEKPSFQTLSITKHVDSASPKLLQSSVTGTHLHSALLSIRNVPGKNASLVIDMKGVVVASMSTSFSGETKKLSEQIDLTCKSFVYKYVAQDQKGDDLYVDPTLVVKKFAWDVAANREAHS